MSFHFGEKTKTKNKLAQDDESVCILRPIQTVPVMRHRFSCTICAITRITDKYGPVRFSM